MGLPVLTQVPHLESGCLPPFPAPDRTPAEMEAHSTAASQLLQPFRVMSSPDQGSLQPKVRAMLSCRLGESHISPAENGLARSKRAQHSLPAAHLLRQAEDSPDLAVKPPLAGGTRLDLHSRYHSCFTLAAQHRLS